MSNSIAPGSSTDVNVKVTALTTNPNVPVTYKTIILKKNLVNGVNTLTQEMMSATNTKYVIKYDYVLGDDVNVPNNCILEFDGGSISASGNNDTITGNNTGINAGLVKIFNTDITLVGNWNINKVYVQWFGAIGDNNIDCTNNIQQAIIVGKNIDKYVYFEEGIYKITDTIYVATDCRISGNTTGSRFNKYSRILQYSNKPIIEINNIESIGDHNNYYTDISIEGLALEFIDEQSYKSYGLFYNAENEDIDKIKVFQHCVFKRLYITNAKFGIYFKFSREGYGFGYNIFEDVSCYSNIIGLLIEGGVWANLNMFDRCMFSSNKNNGVYISVNTIENNRFESCSIEGNGYDYDTAIYNQYGSSGITLLNGKGINTLDNCYIEHNYPRNTENVLPNDIDTNFLVATCVIKGSGLNLLSNVIAGYYRVVNIGDTHAYLNFARNNDIYKGINENIKAPVKIYNSTYNALNPRVVSLNFDIAIEGYYTYFTHAFDLESATVTAPINFNVHDTSNVGNENKLSVNPQLGVYENEELTLFVSNSNNAGWGLIKESPFNSFEAIKDNIYIQNKKEIRISLLSDITIPTAVNTSFNSKKLIVNGNNNKLTFGAYIHNYHANEIIFNNIEFSQTITYGFRIEDVDTVKLNNCTIDLNGEVYSLFNKNESFRNITKIILNNCTITNCDNKRICSGDLSVVELYFNNTTIPNGLDTNNRLGYNTTKYNRWYETLSNDVLVFSSNLQKYVKHSKVGDSMVWLDENNEFANIRHSGTFAQKETPNNIGFQYFNTDTNKTITWSGVKWYNPDGTEAIE